MTDERALPNHILKATFSLFAIALLFQGCVVAAVPIYYYMTANSESAIVKLNVKPQKVYETFKGEILERSDEFQITSDDPESYTIEFTDGTDTAIIKAVPLEDGGSLLRLTVDDVDGTEQTERKKALNGAKWVADELGVKYVVVEE